MFSFYLTCPNHSHHEGKSGRGLKVETWSWELEKRPMWNINYCLAHRSVWQECFLVCVKLPWSYPTQHVLCEGGTKWGTNFFLWFETYSYLETGMTSALEISAFLGLPLLRLKACTPSMQNTWHAENFWWPCYETARSVETMIMPDAQKQKTGKEH